MDIEIFLDCDEVAPAELPLVMHKFNEWYTDGAEVRCNKFPFNSLRPLPAPHRFLVDLGYADIIPSLRNLHARIHRHGAKVFFHFS